MVNRGLTVGASAVSVTLLKAPELGLRIKADENNGGSVSYGFRSDITAESGAETDGFPVPPGEEEFVPRNHFVRRTGQPEHLTVWFRSTAEGRKAYLSYE